MKKIKLKFIENKYKINLSIFLSLIIPLLISGPFFPDLIVTLSSLMFLFYIFKDKFFFYFTKQPLIIFFIFCVYCVFVSLFVADDIMLSLESSLFYFRIGVFSCFVWYLIEQDKKILKYFYYSLILCFSALVLDGYYQYFTGFNILDFPMEYNRISSFFGEEKKMGSYLSRLFPLLFALFLVKKKQKFEIYFVGFLFILVDVLIFVSGERTAFFFLNLSTIFIIILIKEYQIFRLITFIVAVICIFVLSINSSNLNERMFKDPAKDMGIIKSSKQRVIFTEAHDSLYRTSFKMFLDKPVFGHGPKMFRVICKDKKYATGVSPCMTHPHNFYIQLLAETGIIGFLFLFSALSYVIYTALRQLKSIILGEKRPLNDYQICLLAGILITVWPLSTNGNFYNNWLMIVYSLTVGFYLHSIYGKNRENIL